jgi:hypothetical protein
MTVPRLSSATTSFPKSGSSSEHDIMLIGGENAAAGFLFTNEVYTTSGNDLIK